ncbi:unnamed protein product, partial [Gulo gulo]
GAAPQRGPAGGPRCGWGWGSERGGHKSGGARSPRSPCADTSEDRHCRRSFVPWPFYLSRVFYLACPLEPSPKLESTPDPSRSQNASPSHSCLLLSLILRGLSWLRISLLKIR